MGKICHIEGVKLGCASSNTRYGKRNDSLVITLNKESTLSGKFTSNSFKAAPVKIAIKNLQSLIKGEKALVINAGNANAATGSKGIKDVKNYCKEIGSLLNINPSNVIPFSTGVIGEPLPADKYLSAFKKALPLLDKKNWKDAAQSILTTDTKQKLISKEIKIGKRIFSITGFAKGSGMIRPDFATLLSFVFVDAKLNSNSLEKIHSDALSQSFEALTIDGDTSPNDSSLLVATGKKDKQIKKNSNEERALKLAIKEVFEQLSQLLVQDAEGATKKVSVNVAKAKTLKQAKSVAFTVAESPLVKTALFGNDANWGRILSAIGRDSEINDVSRVSISINGQPMVKKGNLDPKHSEKSAARALKKKNIEINISLGLGKKEFKVLTSDLSEDYVLINSDYRS
ncbi:MAG: bifunctional ornithine acetyltransferase/N-acetylglutamate synthase [Gammaproteobacteria bacterium]|jgi:glutamate N-acetyltransferase/amino-acid N-acetyltransferase|nr:bifunctional ornithine acetyltransferase/N-acetylglutamate synthase [Gammaproteobacteria bacterium]HJL95452.1 bifunctional glutamate N-acetyltransferase/amino-acid acetyltransferase ArgJ [SAR86 cluster bacterium]HJM59816.1 bifunctional glutamate N-acetyltransferase/amino-acid acetyltransferase ArgJ [SAR86 cluster bacterium]|tara:strand:+ start:9334 stop:10530 length:1197 start_codon:yes stop_codon:yes gene_type:complete